MIQAPPANARFRKHCFIHLLPVPTPSSRVSFFLFHWSLVTGHCSLPRSGLFHVRLITVTSGLALSRTGVKVVPIPRLT